MTTDTLYAGDRRAIAAELLSHDSWSPDRLRSFQQERLRDLLRHAVSSSPYYRDALGEHVAGDDIELAELPILSKATLMEEFDRIATDPRLRRAHVEAHAGGPNAGELYAGEFRVCATSGTTGEHALIAYTRREFETWMGAALRMLARLGATPGTRVATIGAPSVLHLSRQIFASLHEGRPGGLQLSVTTPLPELTSALQTYQPEAITTYPSIASLLAEEQLQGRLAINPHLVAVGSEVLTEDAERRMEWAWGIKAANIYASTELPLVAASSADHVGLHVSEDLAVVEVVDDRGRPVAPGTPGHKVLVTNLVARAQPLIRYEISDAVVLAGGDDPSGRPYLRIARVDGRDDDTLVLPARGGGRVPVHPYRLRAPFSALPQVRQYQLVHDAAGIRARIVLRDDAPADLALRIRAQLAEAIEAAGAVAPPVRVETVAGIEREPGIAAKLRLVKSLVASS
jgi:phenylacetate-coenzyme A ligase PaaK-like adenylate-forming protein